MKHPWWCLLVLVATTASAQEVTGRLEGRVLTPDGIPLRDVEVIVSSQSLLGTRTATTDQVGAFRFPALPVGAYRVWARRVGLRPVVVEGVPVRLGATASLPRLVLEPQAAVQLPEMVVTADAAGLDLSGTANRTSLDIPMLDALPLERNFRQITLLAPQATPSFYGDGINVGGATGFENTYFVDGINITSPINGGTSMDLPYNFIQEIEVRTGGATAEDPQALGGVVNVVTPSGGNEFHGSAFGFWSGDAVQTATRAVGGATQSGFTFYDAGLTLSGPVLRDRLWFFAAYNRNTERRNHTYNFGTLADTRRQDLFAGKLSWRAGQHTVATFTLLGDPSRLEPLAYPLFVSGTPLNREVLERKDEAGGVGVSLRAQHFLTPALLVELAASQMSRLESGEPASARGRTPLVRDAVTGTLEGGHGFGYEYDSRRRSLRADVTWQWRGHDLKGGLEYQELLNTMSFCSLRTTCGGTIDRLDPVTYTWFLFGSLNGRGKVRNPALYLQNRWQLSPRLVVSAGTRWSRQDVIDAAADTTNFVIRDRLQPRLGIVFQPSASGVQRVFASYARVAWPLALFHAQGYAIAAESLWIFPQDPRADTSGGTLNYAILYPAGGEAADQDLRGQSSDEWTVGYDRRVGEALVLSLRAVRRGVRDVVVQGNDTTLTNVYVWGNPGRGALVHFPRPTRTYDALEFALERAGSGPTRYRVSYVLSRTRGNYTGLYITDWAPDFPATSSTGPMYGFPSQHAGGSGLLPNDRTHLIKAHGSHQFSFGLGLGASLLVASGTPRTAYGAIPEIPFLPWRGLASRRGTAGRTPALWDLGLRVTYDLEISRFAVRPRMLLDLQHIGSPRAALTYDQQRYGCLDANGSQSCPNANYGRVTQYQPAMTARLGVVVGF